MPGTNCWTKKSHLQIGTTIILLVTIPTLLALILSYILIPMKCSYSTVYCETICNITKIEKVKLELMDFNDPESSALIPERLDTRNTKSICKCTFTYLAAIFEYYYADDAFHQRFMCSAAIISLNMLLATKKCVTNNIVVGNKVNGLFSRAGSDYWSTGGSVRTIVQSFSNGSFPLVILRVDNRFSTEFPISVINILQDVVYQDLTMVESVSWSTNNKYPLKLRKQFISPQKTRLTINNSLCKNVSDLDYFCATSKNLTNQHSKDFIVIYDKKLIGIMTDVFDKSNDQPVYLIYNVIKNVFWRNKVTDNFLYVLGFTNVGTFVAFV